jgi:hypothetical protein
MGLVTWLAHEDHHGHHSHAALHRAKSALPRNATTKDLVEKITARPPTVGPGSTVLAAAGLATLAARKAQRALDAAAAAVEGSARESSRRVVDEMSVEPLQPDMSVSTSTKTHAAPGGLSSRFSSMRRSTRIGVAKIRKDRSKKGAPAAGAVLTAVIEMNGGKLTLDCDTLVQHTVVWSEPIPFDEPINEDSVLLRAGSINLYKFPLVTPHTEAGLLPLPDVMPNAAEIRHLEQLVTALMNDEESRFSMAADVSGAKPIHALLIANTEPAVGLCLELIKHRPERYDDQPSHEQSLSPLACTRAWSL